MDTSQSNQANFASQPSQPSPSMRFTLASLSLSMLIPSLGTSIANTGLPTLAQAFGAPFQSVQWVVLAYLLAITTLIVGVGRFGDITGRRRLLLAGILLFTLASLMCGAAPELWVLVAERAVQGLEKTPTALPPKTGHPVGYTSGSRGDTPSVLRRSGTRPMPAVAQSVMCIE